jgi:hypothetical protein
MIRPTWRPGHDDRVLTAVARQWRRSGATFAALLAAGTATLATLLVPAQAEDGGQLLVDLEGDGQGFVRESDEPWLHVEDLAPGSVVTRDLVLWNTSSGAATLDLQVTDLVDDENGCIRPERQVATEGCEGDGGELSRWLTLELVERGASGSPGATVLADLTSGRRLDLTIGPDEKLPLTLRLEFSPESVNDTMTDTVEFATVVTAAHAEITTSSVTRTSGPLGDGPMAVSGRGSTAALGAAERVSLLGADVALPLVGATLPLWVVLLDLALVAALLTFMGPAWRRPRA